MILQRAKSPGFVYLMESDNGLYKIGATKDLKNRLKSLNSSSAKITCIHTIKSDDMLMAESRLHRNYKNERRYGEWFELTLDQVNFIKRITAYHDGNFMTFKEEKV
jgi:hypothetical protein